MADRTLSFEIFARDRASQAFDSAAKSSDGLFGKLKGLGGFLAGGALAAGAVQAGRAITGMVGDALKEAAEAEKVGRITENAIRATGGAANITGAQIGDLATKISNAAAVDDELVQSGANLLLTFKNIRNEAGKNNDVFNQATQAAVDLSAAGFGSVESASIQLGKALNDPLKGIAALGKSGVTFTAQQKEQIKTLVESGKTLEAQKIILGEINAQVGGAAAAAADPMARLAVVTGNLKEQLGAALLPVVTKVAEFMSDRLPGALDAVMAAIGPVIYQVRLFADALVNGFQGGNFFSDGNRFLDLFHTIGGVIRPVVDFIRDNLKPILVALGVTLAVLTSPIGVMVAAVIYAYTQFDTFRNVVNTVVEFLTGTVAPAVAAFAGIVAGHFSTLAGWVREQWGAIQEAISHVVNAVQAAVGAAVRVVTGLWQLLGDDVLRIVRGMWAQVVDAFRFAVGLVSGVVKVIVNLINGDFSKAGEAVKGIFRDLVHFIGQTLGNLGNVVSGALGGVFSLLRDSTGRFVGVGVDMVQGLISGIGSMAGALARFVADFIKRNTIDKVKGVLGISSPSKVFAEIGRYTVAGFNVGVDGTPVATIPFPSIAGAVALAGLAAAGSLALPAGSSVDVRVFLGDRELTDIVRTEVRSRDGALLDALAAGVGGGV